MKNSVYPNLKQSIFLFFLFFLSFSIYFFLTFSVPQLLGFSITKFWKDIIYSLASPAATLPLIFFVSSKGGIKPQWCPTLPNVKVILLLVLLSFSVRIITSPLINPFDFIDNLFYGKLRLLIIDVKKLNTGLIVSFIITVTLVPIVEETFWRKQVLGMLLKKTSPFVAIIISSVLFAFAHLKFTEFGFLFIWGLLFGFIFYKTKSIVYSMILHFAAICSGFLTEFKIQNLDYIVILIQITIFLICILIMIFTIKWIIRESSTKYRE